tara:strand:+ start:909 stop:1091 length:183 start_codon:yes stop_codon:yes gene_type:complete
MSDEDINEVCLAAALQWQKEEAQIRAKLRTDLSAEELIETMEQAKELQKKLKQLQNRIIK